MKQQIHPRIKILIVFIIFLILLPLVFTSQSKQADGGIQVPRGYESYYLQFHTLVPLKNGASYLLISQKESEL